MTRFLASAFIMSAVAVAAYAGTGDEDQPWRSSAIGVESGVLWQVGNNTPFPYRMLQTQISWRSPRVFGRAFSDRTQLLVRHRFTLLATAVQGGPESRYVAFSASPSIEYWNAAGSTCFFTSAGGGAGLIDSRDIKGGQGQDFTLNWFARAGVERVVSRHWQLSAAVMFQHLSNGGQTNPNPGIDVLGFMLGCSWSR